MKNFNWNNYVGEHMCEPLRVVKKQYNSKRRELIIEINSSNYYHIVTSELYTFKPLIKSISDLTDKELLWMFTGSNNLGKNVCIGRTETYIYLKRWKNDTFYENSLHLRKSMFRHCDQKILNRLYSLHVSLNYEELIKNNLAAKEI